MNVNKWPKNDPKKLTVAWFSAGVSSAVATKLAIDQIDKIIYTHIDDQHPDTMRFIKECEGWFGKRVEIIQSKHSTVESVCLKTRYINGPAGAACTRLLKKKVRLDWEQENEGLHLCYVWGMDVSEKHRAYGKFGLVNTMSAQEHIFPLIDREMSKSASHKVLKASGIKRPLMYDLGYQNNNCIGCVKGGMGYWNKIRTDFPGVFNKRAAMEREIGHSCINGIFLDELMPGAGMDDGPVVEDCGIFCELMAME